MIHIRPHQVFHMVNSDDRKFNMQLPSSKTGLSSLETCILAALLKAVKPQRIFEFGTYLGETTLTLAYNLESEDNRIFTLDLPNTEGVEFQGRDEKCAKVGTSSHRYFENSEYADKIIQLLGDSLYFNPKEYIGSIQYIFIDGNHLPRYASKDTENALLMLDKHVPSCIIWHDYRNPDHPELTKYLDELSEKYHLYHVEETMMVVYLNKCNIAPKVI